MTTVHKTAAELQIEALRKMRDAKAKHKPAPIPRAAKVVAAQSKPASPSLSALSKASSSKPGFELIEPPKASKTIEVATIQVSAEIWKRLRERQASSKEFKNKQDMGDWAAELLLALPVRSHELSRSAKAELFQRMQEWCAARGLL